MFEEFEKKITASTDIQIRKLMHQSILHIARMVYPVSVTSIATDARLILNDTRLELNNWLINNHERFDLQRSLFIDFLSRIKAMQSRINRITK